MKKKANGYTLVEVLIVLVMVLVIPAVIWFKIWLLGSLVTSGLKTATNHCGVTYAIEGVLGISGDWFCPARER